MGQAQSVSDCGCLGALKRQRDREAWLEQRCAELAAQNEALRLKLREAQPAQSPLERRRPSLPPGGVTLPGVVPPPTVMSPSREMAQSTQRQGSSTDLAAMAVAAAAESVAEYQRSMVKVTIDNESQGSSTVVLVRAPNRRRLLADMSGALTGLGLLVIEASINTNGHHALNRFVLQETGGKVLEPERLHAIEQRLQQRFCGAQGLNGGVRRLMVDRFIRAVPQWEHISIGPAEPPAAESALWVAMLSLGLRGGSSLGIVSASLATKLALDLLPEMTRMQLPRGGSITNEQTAGEWLLLLEGRMPCRFAVEPESPTWHAMRSNGWSDHRDLSASSSGSPRGSPMQVACAGVGAGAACECCRVWRRCRGSVRVLPRLASVPGSRVAPMRVAPMRISPAAEAFRSAAFQFPSPRPFAARRHEPRGAAHNTDRQA